MLTIREAQGRTGLSYATISRSIVDGKIRNVKQGNKYLVYEEDLHLLPKPRHTGVQQHIAETVEVPQDHPFLPDISPLSGGQLVEIERYKAEQERWKAEQERLKWKAAAAYAKRNSA